MPGSEVLQTSNRVVPWDATLGCRAESYESIASAPKIHRTHATQLSYGVRSQLQHNDSIQPFPTSQPVESTMNTNIPLLWELSIVQDMGWVARFILWAIGYFRAWTFGRLWQETNFGIWPQQKIFKRNMWRFLLGCSSTMWIAGRCSHQKWSTKWSKSWIKCLTLF